MKPEEKAAVLKSLEAAARTLAEPEPITHWCREMEDGRVVACDYAEVPVGRERWSIVDLIGPTIETAIRIHTQFECVINHDAEGKPVFFETMVFGGEFDQRFWRYATRAEAIKGHAEVVAMVRTALRGEE